MKRIGIASTLATVSAAVALAAAFDFGLKQEQQLGAHANQLLGVVKPVAASSTESVDAATAEADPHGTRDGGEGPEGESRDRGGVKRCRYVREGQRARPAVVETAPEGADVVVQQSADDLAPVLGRDDWRDRRATGLGPRDALARLLLDCAMRVSRRGEMVREHCRREHYGAANGDPEPPCPVFRVHGRSSTSAPSTRRLCVRVGANGEVGNAITTRGNRPWISGRPVGLRAPVGGLG
jgi:hypothetical protein